MYVRGGETTYTYYVVDRRPSTPNSNVEIRQFREKML